MKILPILIVVLGFSQCGSNTFVKSTPFNVEKAFYNNWVGGQPGVGGLKLEIYISKTSEINFDSLYFHHKRTKVEVVQLDDKLQLIGHFSTSKRKNRDLILDIDPNKELKNTLPNIQKFPFELKENEAVISYKIEGKTMFFKVENIKKVKSILFPSANKI